MSHAWALKHLIIVVSPRTCKIFLKHYRFSVMANTLK